MIDSALSGKEFAQWANALFEERVRATYKFVAIDIETDAYAVDEDERQVIEQLLESQSDARGRILYRRLGTESVHRALTRGKK